MGGEIHMENLKVLWNWTLIPAPLLKSINCNCLLKYDQDDFRKFIWVELFFFLNKKKEIIASQQLLAQVTTFKFEKP